MSIDLSRSQLASPSALPQSVVTASWRLARKRSDEDLMGRVLARKECPREVLEEGAKLRSPGVRVAVLTSPALPRARFAALLETERRAGVLASLSARGVHAKLVRERVRTMFTTKATVALAPVVVGDAAIDEVVRVEAAVLAGSRFAQQSGETQIALRELMESCSAGALQRYAQGVEEPELLERALAREELADAAQLHAFEVLVERVAAEMGRTPHWWTRNQQERTLLRALQVLHGREELCAEVRTRAAELAASAPSEEIREVLESLARGETASTRSYEDRVAEAGAKGEYDLVEALIADLECPSELLAELAEMIIEVLSPELPGVLARTEDAAFVDALVAENAGEYLAQLGWRGISSQRRQEVVASLDGDAFLTLAIAGQLELLTDEELATVTWDAVGAVVGSWHRDAAGALGARIAKLQDEVLGDSSEAWEVYAALSESHRGSVAELLQACVDVVGEAS